MDAPDDDGVDSFTASLRHFVNANITDRRCIAMPSDNNCFYHGVAYMLNATGRERDITSAKLRKLVVQWMLLALTEDNHRAGMCNMSAMRAEQISHNGVWAADSEMYAISHHYDCSVTVTRFNADHTGVVNESYSWLRGPQSTDEITEGFNTIRLAFHDYHYDAIMMNDNHRDEKQQDSAHHAVHSSPISERSGKRRNEEHRSLASDLQVASTLNTTIMDPGMRSYINSAAMVAHMTRQSDPRSIYRVNDRDSMRLIMQFLDLASIFNMAMTSRHILVQSNADCVWQHAASSSSMALSVYRTPLTQHDHNGEMMFNILRPRVKSLYFHDILDCDRYVNAIRDCHTLTSLKVNFWRPSPSSSTILSFPSLRSTIRHLDIRSKWTQSAHRAVVLDALQHFSSLTSLCLRKFSRAMDASLMMDIFPAIPRTVTSFACEIQMYSGIGVVHTAVTVGAAVALHSRINRLRIILVDSGQWDLSTRTANEVHKVLSTVLIDRAAVRIDAYEYDDHNDDLDKRLSLY